MRPLRRNRRSGRALHLLAHPSESANRRWSWIDVGKPQHVSARMCPETRGRQLTEAAAIGAAAGLVGVAAMTLAEQGEQKITGRPDSFVPARALLTLLGRRPGPSERPVMWNHVMHWGTGALRGVSASCDHHRAIGTSVHTSGDSHILELIDKSLRTARRSSRFSPSGAHRGCTNRRLVPSGRLARAVSSSGCCQQADPAACDGSSRSAFTP